MIRKIVFVIILISALSCQKTNDYYSDSNDSSIERLRVEGVKALDVSFSVVKINKKIVIASYIRLLEPTIDIDDISFRIYGVENPVSEKKEFYKENGERFSFYEFNEIKDYINSQINIYTSVNYYIEDPRVINIDDLKIDITIKSNLGIFNKQFVMKKHSRYRFFLEGG